MIKTIKTAKMFITNFHLYFGYIIAAGYIGGNYDNIYNYTIVFAI